MKCKTCETEGRKSTITCGGSFSTCMGGHSYYDEEGAYHNHDPNYHCTSYRCSNGHAWAVTRVNGCRACGDPGEEWIGHYLDKDARAAAKAAKIAPHLGEQP